MKNLIAINDLESLNTELKNALMPHQKKYQTSQTKSASIGENGLITIILPDLPVSGQLELLNKIKCTWPKLKVVFIGKDPGANDVISLFRGVLLII